MLSNYRLKTAVENGVACIITSTKKSHISSPPDDEYIEKLKKLRARLKNTNDPSEIKKVYMSMFKLYVDARYTFRDAMTLMESDAIDAGTHKIVTVDSFFSQLTAGEYIVDENCELVDEVTHKQGKTSKSKKKDKEKDGPAEAAKDLAPKKEVEEASKKISDILDENMAAFAAMYMLGDDDVISKKTVQEVSEAFKEKFANMKAEIKSKLSELSHDQLQEFMKSWGTTEAIRKGLASMIQELSDAASEDEEPVVVAAEAIQEETTKDKVPEETNEIIKEAQGNINKAEALVEQMTAQSNPPVVDSMSLQTPPAAANTMPPAFPMMPVSIADKPLGFDIRNFMKEANKQNPVAPQQQPNPFVPPAPVAAPATPVVQENRPGPVFRQLAGADINRKLEELKKHVRFITGTHKGDKAFNYNQVSAMLDMVMGSKTKSELKKNKFAGKPNNPFLKEVPVDMYPIEGHDNCDICFTADLRDKTRVLLIRFQTTPIWNDNAGAWINEISYKVVTRINPPKKEDKLATANAEPAKQEAAAVPAMA